MNKRLVAFGCSHTFGVGLPDSEYCKKRDTSFKPSQLSWAGHVAKTMNRELVNKGWPGGSNKRIWHSIVNFDYHDDDLVIIQWSHFQRFVFFFPELEEKIHPNYRRINLHMVGKSIFKDKCLPHDNIFYEHFYCPYDLQVDMLLRIQAAQDFFDKRNIRYYQIPFLYSSNWKWAKEHKWWYPKNNIDLYFDEYRNEYPTALDNRHLGEQGQRQFGIDIVNEINARENTNCT